MISNNSRYVNSKLVTQVRDDGTQVVVITPSDAQSYTFTYTFYMVTGADRIDTIAYAFYGDATKWWKIGDANPEILDWSKIKTGTVLRIPNA